MAGASAPSGDRGRRGIEPATAGGVAGAGASLFVAGSAVFGADNPAAAYTAIAEAAGAV